MTKWLRIIGIGIVAPFGLFYVLWEVGRWLGRKVRDAHAEEMKTIHNPKWRRDLARQTAYEEFQGALDEPRTWDRPRPVSEGPVIERYKAAR